MLYQKNFPKQRQPYYWAVVSGHLAATAHDATEGERRLFHGLSHRLMAKAATDATSIATGKSTPGSTSRALGKPGDLLLLVKVYRSQGLFHQALDILLDPHIGLRSSVGRCSWDLIRECIKLQQKLGHWKDLWEFCHNILLDALPYREQIKQTDSLVLGQLGDDWLVWEALITSTMALETVEIGTQTRDLIREFATHGESSLNACQALVYYESLRQEVVMVEESPLLATTLSYFKNYAAKPIAFESVNAYANQLQPSLQWMLLTHASQHVHTIPPTLKDDNSKQAHWVVAEINSLKLDYSLIMSHDGDGTSTPNSSGTTESEDNSNLSVPSDEWMTKSKLFDAFICTCLRLYRIARSVGKGTPASDRRPADDAALLAATACVRLYYEGGIAKRLWQAIIILEMLLIDSKHNYSAILLLMQLYAFFGATHKVLEWSEKLDMKNIQEYSTLWLIYTRVSTLAPNMKGRRDATNITSSMVDSARWMHKSHQNMINSISMYLEYDSYTSLIDQMNMIRQSTHFSASFLLCTELKRLDRFQHTKYSQVIKWPSALSSHFEECRDFKGFPNYEAPDQAEIQTCILAGPRPRENWCMLHCNVEQLGILLAIEELDLARRPMIPCLRAFVEDLPGTSDLTQAEVEMDFLMRYIVAAFSGCLTAQGDIAVLEQIGFIERWLKERITQVMELVDDYSMLGEGCLDFGEELQAPAWEFYHELWMNLDATGFIVKAMDRICSFCKRNAKVSGPAMVVRSAQINELCKILLSVSRKVARQWREHLSRPLALEQLRKIAFGKEVEGKQSSIGAEIESLVDVDQVTGWAASTLQSWKMGLKDYETYRSQGSI
ncbi:hypothetical protein MMC25_001546 [Agyrium rufum]|nr:hypothetical protein [Agyrium rufum]